MTVDICEPTGLFDTIETAAKNGFIMFFGFESILRFTFAPAITSTRSPEDSTPVIIDTIPIIRPPSAGRNAMYTPENVGINISPSFIACWNIHTAPAANAPKISARKTSSQYDIF